MSEEETIPEGNSASSGKTVIAERPAIFIALGGTGANVLRRLRRRFAERRSASTNASPLSPDLWCGRPARPDEAGGTPAPQTRFLALDTDALSLRSADDKGDSLSPEEVLHLPLRKPAEYRSASDEILSWLSRRWLYNIPRSLRTEGLRPLGRLAFVDHRLAIAERLRRLLACPSPRVFIVASIDGGAGGGMLLDVAYAVRQQLDELQLPTDCLCGLLLHATLAHGSANDLRKANAYATLTELNHFMQGNAAYRAGPVEVLPAGDVSEPPFHDAYFLDLGEELSDAGFGEAIDQVAEYLYLNATSCAAALDEARRTTNVPRGAAGGPVHLRSFALHAVSVDKQAIAAAEADRLCLHLVQQWLGENANGSPYEASIQPPSFTLADLAGRVQSIAEKALGGSAEVHFRSLVTIDTGLVGLRTEDPAGPYADQLRRIHAVFGLPVADASQSGPLTHLEATVRDGSQKLAAAMGDLVVQSIADVVEQPQARVPAALAGANLFQEHVRDLRQAAVEILRQEHARATALWTTLQRGDLPRRRAWLRSSSVVNDDAERQLLDYCRLRLQAMSYQYVVNWLQDLAAKIAVLCERLGKLRQALRQLSADFAAAVERDLNNDKTNGAASLDALRRFAEPEYLLEFESTQVRPLFAARGGLMGLAEDDPDHWGNIRRQLHALARQTVLQALSEVDAASILLDQCASVPALADWVAQSLAKSLPRLAKCDDAGRLLALLPNTSHGEKIAAAVRDRAADAVVLPSRDGDVVLLREVDRIVLSEVATALVASSGDCAAAARRVLTRVDVSWTLLPTQQNAGV